MQLRALGGKLKLKICSVLFPVFSENRKYFNFLRTAYGTCRAAENVVLVTQGGYREDIMSIQKVTRRKIAVAFLFAVAAICLLASVYALAPFASARAAEGGTLLTDGSSAYGSLINQPIVREGDALLNSDPAVEIVSGGVNKKMGGISFLQRGAAPVLAADALASSSDGKVIDLKVHYWDQGVAKIVFSSPIEVNSSKILTFRMWFDMDRNSVTQSIGRYHFYANRKDIGGKYFYRTEEMAAKQRQWVDIRLEGQQVLNLADENGRIEALYIVSTTHWDEFHRVGFDNPPEAPYGHIYIDEIRCENAPDHGGYPYLTTMDPVTAELNDNPIETDPDLSAQGGISGVEGMVIGGLSFANRAFITADLPAGSQDGKGISFDIVDSHQGLAHIKFKKLKDGQTVASSVKASEIAGISVRVWVDVEEDVTSENYIRGNYFLLSNRYDIENRYMYSFKLRCNQQKQWLDLIITGEDLMNLADPQGNIEGLYFYYDTHNTTHPRGGKFYFDSIRYDSYDVRFIDGDKTIEARKVVYGDKISSPALEVPEGKVFAGWTTDLANARENLYRFSESVVSDTELHAWWLNAAQNQLDTGLYVNEKGDEISVFDGNIAYMKGVIPYGSVFVLGTDGKSNYAVLAYNGNSYCFVYESGKIHFGDEEFTRIQAHTVTYSHYKGSSEHRYVQNGGSAENIAPPERAGFSFVGWSQNGTDLFDFGKTSVTGDLRLTALWDYVEVSDPSAIYGTYYFAEKDLKIVLKEEGVAQIISGADVSETKYHYLVSDQLVFDRDKDSVLDFDPLHRSFVYEGGRYTLLGKYFVYFYVNDILISRVTVESGDYKITAPAEPERQGYVFKGWQTSDGQSFDPSATVTQSVSVHAVWEKVGADADKAENDAGSAAVWVALGVTLAAVVAFGGGMLFLVKSKLKK